MMRLSVDTALCEGYGNCVFEAEDYCELEDDGPVRLLRAEVDARDLERVELAAASCPVSALLLESERPESSSSAAPSAAYGRPNSSAGRGTPAPSPSWSASITCPMTSRPSRRRCWTETRRVHRP